MSDPVPGQQIINDGAVLTDDDRIVAVGERNSVLSNLIPAKADQSIQESVDCGGGLLLPGLSIVTPILFLRETGLWNLNDAWKA